MGAKWPGPSKDTPGWAWPHTSKAIKEVLHFPESETRRVLVRTTPFIATARRKKTNKKRPVNR